MKWLITLKATSEADVERILAEKIEGISRVPGESSKLMLALDFPDAPEDDATARAHIEVYLFRLNGISRIRWGRAFQGVELLSVQVIEASGGIGARVFADAVTAYLTYEDFATFVEGLGLDRPVEPKGLAHIEGIDFQAALATAEKSPAAARAMQLVDLMLHGSGEINWSAAYAAMETVEHELGKQGIEGHQLGWWTKREMKNFTATANSPEVLGTAARHGKPSGLSEARMSPTEASWFIRRVIAQWLASPYALTAPEANVEDS